MQPHKFQLNLILAWAQKPTVVWLPPTICKCQAMLEAWRKKIGVGNGGLGNGIKYDLVLVAWQNQLAYGTLMAMTMTMTKAEATKAWNAIKLSQYVWDRLNDRTRVRRSKCLILIKILVYRSIIRSKCEKVDESCLWRSDPNKLKHTHIVKSLANVLYTSFIADRLLTNYLTTFRQRGDLFCWMPA